MERKFVTGDTDYDYSFAPVDRDTSDPINIRANMAKLQINAGTYSTSLTNQEAKAINVYNGATTLAASMVGVAALALASF